jgi:hypothetical protein
MWGIKEPDNEWYTGRHYSYKASQDQNRKEIKRLITASTFVDDSDYDVNGYMTIYTEVRYKHYTRKFTREEYAQGARNKKSVNQIETSNEIIDFKIDDRFKLMNQTDDATPKKIVDIDNPQNTYKTSATLMFPGLYNEYNSKVVMTLK